MAFTLRNCFGRLASLLPWQRRLPQESHANDTQDDDGTHGLYAGRTHSIDKRPPLSRVADPVEVAATLPILESLSKHLQQTATDLSDSVLEISSGFGGMATRVRETVQIAQSGLHSHEGSSTDQTIVEIRNVLNSLLTAVKDSAQLSSGLAERIGQLEIVLAGVNSSLMKVEKISDEARIVGLNGRLEAARAGVHGAAFNVVANETKNLGVHASDTSSSIRRQVEQLDQALRSVSFDLQSRITLDAETARKSEDLVIHLLDQLSGMHHGMTSSLQRTEHLSESLSRDIGRSVIALQFQDRVNQRLDHVVETLSALRENLTPFVRQVSPERAEARACDWRVWFESRSTMKSEREVSGSVDASTGGSGHPDFGSIELF